MSDIVEAARFHFLHEAEVAATALEAAGIECALPDRFGPGRTPEGIFTGHDFRILVAVEDRDRAREILVALPGD